MLNWINLILFRLQFWILLLVGNRFLVANVLSLQELLVTDLLIQPKLQHLEVLHFPLLPSLSTLSFFVQKVFQYELHLAYPSLERRKLLNEIAALQIASEYKLLFNSEGSLNQCFLIFHSRNDWRENLYSIKLHFLEISNQYWSILKLGLVLT